MDLSIILVNWKSLDYLRDCLCSIYTYTRDILFEVIVIDNASGDTSEKTIRREYPDVIFLQSRTNLGFAKANNAAFRASRGDIVVFLNPDTEIADNVFARMAACLRRDVSIGAVGARLLNSNGTVQTTSIQAFPTLWNQLLDFDKLRRVFPKWSIWGTKALLCNTDQPIDVDAISGACFMIRRQLFETVGHFTETYFMYVEDLDLSYKVRRAGYRICLLPTCQLVHHGGQSSKNQIPYFASVRQVESLLQFFMVTRGRMYSDCYRLVIASSAVLRLLAVLVSMPLGNLVFRRSTRKIIVQRWWLKLQWAFRTKPAQQLT